MSTVYETICTDCGFRGRYRSRAMADHKFSRHSCSTTEERRARAERRATTLAASGEVRDCAHLQARHQHGTREAYVLDRCRCHPCKVASRTYEQNRRRDIAYGRSTLVDAEPVRQHLRSLMDAGMGWKRIAAASGLANSSVYTILYGKGGANPAECRPPRKQITRANAKRLLAVKPDLADGAVVDSTGTVRRVQALVALGWSQSKLAVRLGILPANFTPLVHGRRKVSVRTARAVAALYDDLWDQQPPQADFRDRIACSRSKRYAAEHRWPPPLAWDDDTIDDPAVRPATSLAVDHNDDLVDDVTFLLDQGLTRAALASRLSIKPNTLEVTLRRRAPEVWQRIVDLERRRREQPRQVA